MKELFSIHRLCSLILFTILLFQTNKVFACSPGMPDPWFNIKLTFDKSTLPPGVEIIEEDLAYERYFLINRSSEPLYLVKENDPEWKKFPFSELPDIYEPHYKLANGQSFYYQREEYPGSLKVGYKLNSGGINNSNASRVRLEGEVYTIDGGSKQVYEDDRPANVEIPEQQPFEISAYYKGAPLQIKGMISYTLNEKYDPKAFQKGADVCNLLDKQVLGIPMLLIIRIIPVLTFLAIILVVIVIAYVFMARRK